MKDRKVLVCPLDWGIGHATRCVPVIRRFMEQGCEVVLAADGRPMAFLQKEFPGLRMIRFPGTPVRYGSGSQMLLKMVRLALRFLYGIWKEHRMLERLLDREPFNVIVSDNRYGLWSNRCRSVLITHQLNLFLPGPAGFLRGPVRHFIRKMIRRFNECWIPDFEMHISLAGELSHPVRKTENAYYIGPLSRFLRAGDLPLPTAPPAVELLVILSGPEPQRTLFEGILFRQLERSDLKTIVVRGITEKNGSFRLQENVAVYDHLDTGMLEETIRNAYLVVSRPGYSTIMDIVTLGKRAVFVPTPGQPEQEYLASHLMKKKIFFSMDQQHFDLSYALEMSVNYPGMVLSNDYETLNHRIREIIR